MSFCEVATKGVEVEVSSTSSRLRCNALAPTHLSCLLCCHLAVIRKVYVVEFGGEESYDGQQVKVLLSEAEMTIERPDLNDGLKQSSSSTDS